MTTRTEELASTLLGKAKGAKAALEGLTGVFRHLVQEHGKTSALLMRLKASSDPDVRRELFPTIRVELLAHEQGELRELYPVLRQNAQTRGIAEAHDIDADRVDSQIEKLTSIAVDSAQWQPNLELLIERVRHHVHEEENEYFPLAQRVFGARSNEMLERFEQAKTQAMKELKATP